MAVTPRCARQAATLMLATSLALPSMAWSARGGRLYRARRHRRQVTPTARFAELFRCSDLSDTSY